MKAFTLFLALLLLPFSTALSLDLNITVHPSETFVIKLPVHVYNTITHQQVVLKRINVEVPFEHDVKRFNEDYYVYGIAPQNSSNYTLFIDNIEISTNGVRSEEDLEIPIYVAGEKVAYNIRPAIAEGSGTVDFIINSLADNSFSIETTLPGKESLLLRPGENELIVSFSTLSQGLNKHTVGMYDVLLYSTAAQEPVREQSRILFYPRRVVGTLFVSDKNPVYFRITNTGDKLQDVSFNYDAKLFTIKPARIENLEPNQSLNATIEFKSRDAEINDNIFLTIDNETYDLPVEIKFTENSSQVILPNALSSVKGYYCSELGGKACSPDQTCSVSVTETLDIVSCCTGVCESPNTRSYAWVGYVLGSLVLIILLYVGLRYFKTKTPGASFSKRLASAEKSFS